MSNIIKQKIDALQFCNPIEVGFSRCATKLIIQTDAVHEAVTFIFTAFNKKRYLYESITDGYGLAIIDVSLLPPEMFTPYSGIWRLTGNISGLPTRINFLSNYGKHPELHITVYMDYYANIDVPNPYVIDTVEYVCCCDEICNINPCELEKE